MRCKKILLINDNNQDIAEIEKALKQINCAHSLHVATKGSDAISMLMGSSSSYNTYYKNSKVQADIILLNKDLGDMPAHEFLSIMRRYYSLKKIKVYLTTQEGEHIPDEEANRLGIAGAISKPFDFTKTDSPVILELKAELASSDQLSAFLTLPPVPDRMNEGFSWKFLNIVKAKTAIVNNAFGLKVAVCAVSAVMVSAVVRYNFVKDSPGPTAQNKTIQTSPVIYTDESAVQREITEMSFKHSSYEALSLAVNKAVLEEWKPGIKVERDTTIN